jgi:hypothetical protein
MGLINISRVTGGSASVPTPPAGVDTLFNEGGLWYFKDSNGLVQVIAAGIITEVGATGPTGPDGPIGATGATGPQGIQGITGATGATGLIGATGATGPQGIQGITGATGATGPQGITGATGSLDGLSTFKIYSGTFSGSDMTGTPLTYDVVFVGTLSDYIVNIESDTPRDWTVSGKVSGGFTAESNSSSPINDIVYWNAQELINDTAIALITGATGATGPQGIQGLEGATGATGPQGIQGITGATGATGPQGIQGITGATGATGPQGIQGITGATGATGPGISSIGPNQIVSFWSGTQTEYDALSPTYSTNVIYFIE